MEEKNKPNKKIEESCPSCNVSSETIEKLKKSKKEEYDSKKQQKEREKPRQLSQKKFKKITALIIVLFLLGSGITFAWLRYSPKGGEKEEKPKITVFYSPTCSCCHEYLPYLKRNGFEVEEKPTQDMLSIKEKYQIPSEMESCHTSIIGDYFVEGHMPVEAIQKLLAEKPEIDGISLPGMPAGSPGMGGFKKEPFKIYSLKDGLASEFLTK